MGPLKVTIEGPQAAGKTRLAFVLVKWCAEQGLSTASLDEGGQRMLHELPPVDVLIIEKQTGA